MIRIEVVGGTSYHEGVSNRLVGVLLSQRTQGEVLQVMGGDEAWRGLVNLPKNSFDAFMYISLWISILKSSLQAKRPSTPPLHISQQLIKNESLRA